MAAILKFFKWHLLPNHKSDLAENWWKASEQHRDSQLLNLFLSNIQGGSHGGDLGVFKQHLLSNGKLEWAKTWWEALGRRGDSAGLRGSFGCAIRLETRRSRVQPPSVSATFFRGDWPWNIFCGHSLPSADSRRAVVSFWRKNVHNTG